MRRLSVFNTISLDGYFTDATGDMRFAYKPERDAEWDEFVAGNASGGGMLVFGRVTYAMMAPVWTSPWAAEHMPVVAERMNAMPKAVFSRTLTSASWSNTTVIHDDPVDAMRALKQTPGPDMAILGSGSVVAQLAPHGVIDEYQCVIAPVALGGGRTMFAGLPSALRLQLTRTRSFRNGNVLLCYTPEGESGP